MIFILLFILYLSTKLNLIGWLIFPFVMVASQPQGQGLIHGSIGILTVGIELALQLPPLMKVIEVGDTLPQRQADLAALQGALEKHRQ